MAPRTKQRERTRRDLIEAARRLTLDGRSPSINDIASAADVSPATAYRYFPNPTSLWLAVAAEEFSPSPHEIFSANDDSDTHARLDTFVREVGWRQFDDEVFWRHLIRASGELWFEQLELPPEDRVPVRGTARLAYIDETIKPLAGQVPAKTLARLRSALALVVGVDALMALRDTCQLPADEAKDVMSWAAQALLSAAEGELRD